MECIIIVERTRKTEENWGRGQVFIKWRPGQPTPALVSLLSPLITPVLPIPGSLAGSGY